MNNFFYKFFTIFFVHKDYIVLHTIHKVYIGYYKIYYHNKLV